MDTNTLVQVAAKAAKDDSLIRDLLNYYHEEVEHNDDLSADDAEEHFDSYERGEIIEALKKMSDLGLGKYVIGRRDYPTRLEFYHDTETWLEAYISRASGQTDAALSVVTLIAHDFRLRKDLKITLNLPDDITASEARRIAGFVETVPFDE